TPGPSALRRHRWSAAGTLRVGKAARERRANPRMAWYRAPGLRVRDPPIPPLAGVRPWHCPVPWLWYRVEHNGLLLDGGADPAAPAGGTGRRPPGDNPRRDTRGRPQVRLAGGIAALALGSRVSRLEGPDPFRERSRCGKSVSLWRGRQSRSRG